MYCTRCGNKIPEDMTTCPKCDKLYAQLYNQSSLNSTYINRINDSFKRLNSCKKIFLVTLCSLVLNIIMSFFDMVDISVLISERSDSFYSFAKYSAEYGLGDAQVLLSYLNFGLFLVIASILLTVLPIILQKTYRRGYLALNYISMIYTFILYVIIISVFSDQSYSNNVNIKITAYLYLIETLFAFISTAIFAKELKRRQSTKSICKH